MPNHIWVFREDCGCINGALFENCWDGLDDENAQFVIEQIRFGYLVSWEERETIGVERCAKHQKFWEEEHDGEQPKR